MVHRNYQIQYFQIMHWVVLSHAFRLLTKYIFCISKISKPALPFILGEPSKMIQDTLMMRVDLSNYLRALTEFIAIHLPSLGITILSKKMVSKITKTLTHRSSSFSKEVKIMRTVFSSAFKNRWNNSSRCMSRSEGRDGRPYVLK